MSFCSFHKKLFMLILNNFSRAALWCTFSCDAQGKSSWGNCAFSLDSNYCRRSCALTISEWMCCFQLFHWKKIYINWYIWYHSEWNFIDFIEKFVAFVIFGQCKRFDGFICSWRISKSSCFFSRFSSSVIILNIYFYLKINGNYT